MIVHVFTADRYHLVPLISKGFATVYKNDANHFFLFYGTKNTNFLMYSKSLNEVGFTDYSFCNTTLSYIRLIKKHRRDSILFHAGSYSWFLYAFVCGCRYVNWVCWGSGAQINNRGLSYFVSPLKRVLYKHFSSIVTLMDEDRKSIIHDFGVPQHKIFTISYMSLGDCITEYDILSKRLLNQNKGMNGKPSILLGNNPGCIKYYILLLRDLAKFSGQVVIHCMLNYSLKKDDDYNELCRIGTSLFSSDFICDETFYSDRIDYIHYMNQCDIYICGNERQSGLGAIETCLKLGKKVYLTGKNLSWIRQEFDAIVFDSKSLSDISFSRFVMPLNQKEKELNYFSSIRRRSKHTARWREYLQMLNDS